MFKPVGVPLTQPDRLLEVSEGLVSHDLSLPVGAQDERILLYPERILGLARSAGAKSVHLTFDREALATPDFTDIESLEGGIAVLRGLRKPKEYYGDFDYDDSTNPAVTGIGVTRGPFTDIPKFRADRLTLEISSPAIKERIVTDKNNERGPLDEALWAKYMNEALKRTLSQATEYRFKDMPTQRTELLAADLGMPILMVAFISVLGGSNNVDVIYKLLISSSMWYGLAPLALKFMMSERLDGFYSPLVFSQADKAFRTSARTRLSPRLVGFNGQE